MDLTEAEDIKKRWQEYTEELYKKDLHDQDNHYGVITDLEPGILVPLLSYVMCRDIESRVHHEKRWAGRSTSWNQDCREKYQ